MFNKRRLYVRDYINKKNIIFCLSVILISVLGGIVISNVLLMNKANKYTKKYTGKNENNNDVIIYSADKNENEVNVNNNIENNNVDSTSNNNNSNDNTTSTKEEIKVEDLSKINLTLLGEIMMGGQVTQNVKYIYSSAFKNIHLYTKDADFTYATLGTNITNVDKIENVKSKYLVTKDVINGICAIGIDAMNIATDHMIDYPENIFNITKSTLEKNDILVAGQKDTPVYFEKGNQKVAIVSTNAVILGTKNKYNEYNISLYDESNFRKNIKEAKKIADVVIADIHWGKEYEFKTTSQMSEIAHIAVDEGANLVIGSHALGVYPISTYKGVPIIYSLGNLISDTDLYVGKESFIFNLEIENERITKMEMIPTYVENKKEIKLYSEYDFEKANEILEMYNRWHIENGLDSKIENNKIVIKF